ncbi:MAG: Tfp pilus assembly protein FimT/FimU [Chthoniobacteraceae bacterium]
MNAAPPDSIRHSSIQAFSMLELMVVLAIMVIMTGLLVPTMLGLKRSRDLTSAAYSIKGALEEARIYAVANNTYTWVGFFEEDGASASSAPAMSGVGRVVICTMTSRDGSAIYNKALASGNTPSVQALTPSRLVQVGKLVKLNNVHIVDATSRNIGTRQAGTLTTKNLVGLSSEPLLFSFQYPLAGAAQYTFGIRPVPTANGSPVANGIVQFDPRGEVITDSGPMTIAAPNKEIAIEESHGNHAVSSQNIIALQLSGLTGEVTMYRP